MYQSCRDRLHRRGGPSGYTMSFFSTCETHVKQGVDGVVLRCRWFSIKKGLKKISSKSHLSSFPPQQYGFLKLKQSTISSVSNANGSSGEAHQQQPLLVTFRLVPWTSLWMSLARCLLCRSTERGSLVKTGTEKVNNRLTFSPTANIHNIRSKPQHSGQFLLLSLVKVFSDVGWQQAPDAVIREEHVKVPQQATLGFIRLVLCLQCVVWYNLQKSEKTSISYLTERSAVYASTVPIKM